ncbi:molybdopterin biosynthesis protein MoeY [Massilia sp. Root351]|uniref:hypothetical protein n=1 Tax=Massilia sp. Root351 TaxID=1736522 RepID=UPI00070FFDC7|nr:hypothetical protein [Massilia sp. Root351]KQV80813.1 molybdopterin biosynthesis protein MoeY [Massilia sp. Root351]
MTQNATVMQILDLARWAPSGDNVQSHRFEVAGPHHVVIHARDTRADCVYDLDGHASQIALGALLETMAIAATAHGWAASAVRRVRAPELDEELIFDVHFNPLAGLPPHPMLPFIVTRAVQRRPMSTRPLGAADKATLEEAAGPDYAVHWLESREEKWRAARLMYRNARLRLTMPEAYEVHRRIIHWGVSHSPDRVPDQALGADAATLRLMKWAMTSWSRLSKVNAMLGTWAPRLQMDLLPGVLCAAHFVLQARRAPASVDDFVDAGRAVQRFWLRLTSLGLYMQPEMTPLIFARYIDEGRRFSKLDALQAQAAELKAETEAMTCGAGRHPVYMGRLGFGPAPVSRAERKPLSELMLP